MPFDLNKENKVFNDFWGARKETIIKLKDLYKKEWFVEGEADRKIMYAREFGRVGEYFNLQKGGNVLDIGCGTGDFLSLFGKDWNKYGIELSNFARNISEKKGIITDFEIQDNFFDIIILRGTIQHIPDPIHRIQNCYYWLKKGGMIIFLCTPNTNSLYYKIFNDLPMLVKECNFLLPSDKMIAQILANFGFIVKAVEYPYLNTPYARPIRDLFFFLLKILGIKKNAQFAFPGNIMDIYAQKP